MSSKLDLFDPNCLPEAQADALSQFVEGVFLPAVERDESSGDAIAKRAGIYTETMRPVVSAMVKAGVETAASFQRAFASINRIAASDASSLEELRKRSQK